jgi:hypothetical protein
VTEDGDQVALAASFDAQHAEAVLFVVERDVLDEAGQDLGWRARPRCLRHHRMMEIKILGRYRDRAPSPMPVGAGLGMSVLREAEVVSSSRNELRRFASRKSQ